MVDLRQSHNRKPKIFKITYTYFRADYDSNGNVEETEKYIDELVTPRDECYDENDARKFAEENFDSIRESASYRLSKRSKFHMYPCEGSPYGLKIESIEEIK